MLPREWSSVVGFLNDNTLYLIIVTSFVLFVYFLYFKVHPVQSLIFTFKLSPRESKYKVFLVYLYCLVSVAVFVIASFVLFEILPVITFMKTHKSLNNFVGSIGMFICMTCVYKLDYNKYFHLKLLFLIFQSILQGGAFSAMKREVFLESIIVVFLVISVLTILSHTADKNFYLLLLGPLSWANGIVLSASVCFSSMDILPDNSEMFLLCINLYAGIIFFSYLYIVNSQLVVRNCFDEINNFDPIYYASMLEINIFNVFVRCASSVKLYSEIHPCDYFEV